MVFKFRKGDQMEDETTKEKELEEKVPTPDQLDDKESVAITDQKNLGLIGRFWYVFLVLGLGAVSVVVYLWYSNQKIIKDLNRQELKVPMRKATLAPVEIEAEVEDEDELLEELEQQSDSDEILEIEKDLSATFLSDLDQELDEIDKELSLP